MLGRGLKCAPVQSVGQLRGSTSLHGLGRHRSCPWTLPPSAYPEASAHPSESHTHNAFVSGTYKECLALYSVHTTGDREGM